MARVASKSLLCEGVVAIDLVPANGETWPVATPGAHIDVRLPNGIVRQYSICDTESVANRYRIAVQREEGGRGGSKWVHDNLQAGDILPISAPRNTFPLIEARNYVFIAGGIGITPILSMAFAARRAGAAFKLFYCTRAPERTAFRDLLSQGEIASRVDIVHDGGDPGRSLNLPAAIGAFAGDARLYCCGPNGLMGAVETVARAQGWPETSLHFERFAPAPATSGGAFSVTINSSGEVLAVPPGMSLLDVLRDAGYFVDSSCEQGICGTCRVGVLSGELDHRDQTLSDAERDAGNVMCACVSRARGANLTLDL